jgi:hypothetical protein
MHSSRPSAPLWLSDSLVLEVQEHALEGVKRATKVHKGLDPVMSKWPPLSQRKPMTVEAVMSNSVLLGQHGSTTNQAAKKQYIANTPKLQCGTPSSQTFF